MTTTRCAKSPPRSRELGYRVRRGRQRRRRARLLRASPHRPAARRLRHARHERRGSRPPGARQAARPADPVRHRLADRAALAGVSETHIIGKPFVNDELATKLRSVLIDEASDKVVRLRR